MAGVSINGTLVVVARKLVQTSETRNVVARVVIRVGKRIVIAGRRVGASFHWQNTIAGVFRGIKVVVQCGFIRATQNLIRVAHTICVGVHARPVAVEPCCRENA